MMKIAVLLAVLIVGTYARAYPFMGQQYNNHYNPYNLDLDDGRPDTQGGAAQQNEPGDTPDDQDEVAAGGQGAAGQGAAGQAGTTLAPVSDDSDSSSSSSSEEEGGVTGGTGGAATTAPPAGPIQGAGAGQAAGGTGAQNAGDSSNGNVDAVGSPIYGQQGGAPQQQPGDDSTANAVDPGIANPLNMKPQAVRQREGRQAGAAVAVTTLLLVGGVAAVSVVAYKYKDAITARLGL